MSLMNSGGGFSAIGAGLSQMGSGIASFAGTAGLEAQKADLANQAAILADKLHLASGMKLQAQQGQIQSGIVGQQTASAQQVANTEAAARTAVAQTEAQATLGAAGMSAAASRDVANIQANAPPDVIKILRDLHMPPFDGAAGSAAAGSSGASGSTAAVTGTAGGADTAPASGAPSPAATAEVTPPALGPSAPPGAAATSAATSADLVKTLVMKSLGLGTPGSEVANRAAIAQDVANDPQFRNASPGVQAAEVDTRAAVASGKMTDPLARHAMAVGIASGMLPGLSNYALTKPGGPETMAEVMKIDPHYDGTIFATRQKARDSLAPGGQMFNTATAMDTAMMHAGHLMDQIKELGNRAAGNWWNTPVNVIAENTGHAPIINAVKQTVMALGSEARRIYAAGGSGSEKELDAWESSFPVNGSPADQVAALRNFVTLVNGKFIPMAEATNAVLGDTAKPISLLVPEARDVYTRLTGSPPAGSDVFLAGKPAQAAPAQSTGTDNRAPLSKIFGQ